MYVDVDWFNGSLRDLMNLPKSDAEHAHVVIGALKSADDPVGVWLSGVPTKNWEDVEASGPQTTLLDVLIPWRFVEALYVVPGEADSKAVGFAAGTFTKL